MQVCIPWHEFSLMNAQSFTVARDFFFSSCLRSFFFYFHRSFALTLRIGILFMARNTSQFDWFSLLVFRCLYFVRCIYAVFVREIDSLSVCLIRSRSFAGSLQQFEVLVLWQPLHLVTWQMPCHTVHIIENGYYYRISTFSWKLSKLVHVILVFGSLSSDWFFLRYRRLPQFSSISFHFSRVVDFH